MTIIPKWLMLAWWHVSRLASAHEEAVEQAEAVGVEGNENGRR